MRNARGVSGVGGAAFAVLLTVAATAAMHAQTERKDGIKVHGHWTLDVQNADGTPASHNEIENELQPGGASALSGLLGRAFTPTSWRLELAGAGGAGACIRTAPPTSPSLVTFTLAEPGATFDQSTNTWTQTQQLAPGAPYFMGVTPAFQWQAPVGDNLPELLVVDPENDSFFTVTLGGTPPAGFAVGDLFWPVPDPGAPLVGHVPFNWNSAGAAPGLYYFSVTLADSQGHSNAYTATINVPPPPSGTGGSSSFLCSAVEAGTPIGADLASAWFPTLTLAVVEGPSQSQNLQLLGEVTVTSAEPITQVNSIIVLSNSTTLSFSGRTLQTPIQVVPGQRVFVKVVFSFS